MLEKGEDEIILTSDSVVRLRSLITDRSNININIYKDAYLVRRLKVRMNAVRYRSPEAYLNYVERNPEEYRKLVSAITINVTRFFRNRPTFEMIKDSIVPEICKNKIQRGEEKITVLCVGCATGEEPYGTAILFMEHFRKSGQSFQLKVIGTDVDKRTLFTAVKGIYSPEKVEKVPKKLLERYFDPVKDGYQVTSVLKERVIFLKKDVFSHRVHRRFDLIICRNLLIYFLRSYQEVVQEGFYRQLLPGGFLVLGRTESLVGKGRQLFETVSITNRIYRKI